MSARTRGFTLLEVLVALAVIAIAMGALIKGGAQNARNAAYLRDKAVAHWVAMNKVSEVQLSQTFPSASTSEGKVEMSDRKWQWRVKVSETPDTDMRRMDVEVRAVVDDHVDDKAVLDKVTAFIPRK